MNRNNKLNQMCTFCTKYTKSLKNLTCTTVGYTFPYSLFCNLSLVLENMSGQGSTVGGDFNELKSIIDRVRDKTRVGVCLDTCHTFAAGKEIYKMQQHNTYDTLF